MRLVQEPDGLEAAFTAASAEAEAAFGDGSLYLEKVVSPARHVEIQVLCDTQGSVLTLGERECSIQRRHQKLVEESPSVAVSPETREEMERSSRVPVSRLGTAVRGRSSSSSGPRASPTSSRSTAGSRSSIPSRSSSPESTSFASRSASRPVSRSRSRVSHRGAGTRSRCGSTPRTRRAGSRRRRASSCGSAHRSGRVSGSTRRSRRGWRSLPTTTR